MPFEPRSLAPAIHRHPVVASTSDLARSLVASEEHALPFVIRADRQTRGRGQADRSWFSDAGSLTFTLALDPAAHGLRPDHEPRLALAAAVAVVDGVSALAPDAPLGIRWPNDVESSGRKLAGLLPERADSPSGPRLLLGIGLNVRTDLASAPPDIRSLATTVEALRGGPLDDSAVESLFADLLARIGQSLALLASDSPDLPARWRSLDTLLGTPVRIDLGPSLLLGRAAGIDPQGALLLDDGRTTRPLFGGRVLRDIPT